MSLVFKVFFFKAQEIFNIFKDHNDPMKEKENIRFMLKKLYLPQLENIVELLEERVMNGLSVSTILFPDANYLVKSATKSPDCIVNNRTFSNVYSYTKMKGVTAKDIQI